MYDCLPVPVAVLNKSRDVSDLFCLVSLTALWNILPMKNISQFLSQAHTLFWSFAQKLNVAEEQDLVCSQKSLLGKHVLIAPTALRFTMYMGTFNLVLAILAWGFQIKNQARRLLIKWKCVFQVAGFDKFASLRLKDSIGLTVRFWKRTYRHRLLLQLHLI